jgi:chemotaxis protein MotB
MAAGGGGSWKVAYADFVTAMMAFFLVMWICAQDQQIKESVAHYFMEPLGGTPIGAASKPAKAGAIFNAQSTGSVPRNESVATGRGRSSYTSRGESSPATKMVGDWLQADHAAHDYWRKQAQLCREEAVWSKDVQSKVKTVEEAAAQILGKQLRSEIADGISDNTVGLHQDLLFAILTDVNWVELAEDLLTDGGLSS